MLLRDLSRFVSGQRCCLNRPRHLSVFDNHVVDAPPGLRQRIPNLVPFSIPQELLTLYRRLRMLLFQICLSRALSVSAFALPVP